jgi:hypothetical protein
LADFTSAAVIIRAAADPGCAARPERSARTPRRTSSTLVTFIGRLMPNEWRNARFFSPLNMRAIPLRRDMANFVAREREGCAAHKRRPHVALAARDLP